MPTKQRTYRRNIQDKAKFLVDDMISIHNKVLPIRLDLRFPEAYVHDGRNAEAEQFAKRIAQHCRYHGIGFRYLLVREQNGSENPHYHGLMLVDGSKHQKPYAIQQLADRNWKSVLGTEVEGLVDYCQPKPGYPIPPLTVIRRPAATATGDDLRMRTAQFEQARDNALRNADYLAKETTKGGASKHDREMLASQVRKQR